VILDELFDVNFLKSVKLVGFLVFRFVFTLFLTFLRLFSLLFFLLGRLIDLRFL
jgi:hypothetical protein